LELHALVQAAILTDDRVGGAEQLAAWTEGHTAADALVAPFLAMGTTTRWPSTC
jgi:hypothetical protein